MRLNTIFQNQKTVFAIEVFPPKKESGIASVYKMLDEVKSLPCDYISVTYSAGGSGHREYTAQIAGYIKQNLAIEALAHLTCSSSTRAEVSKELERLAEAGIQNILALRGDHVPGVTPCREYPHASDLAAAIQADGRFYIAGACYPEGHPESESLAEDIEHLKIKQAAGAGHLVSQLFFDNGKFYRFLNLARKKGLNCPIEAGIMPIVKPEQLQRTISLSSASLPSAFSKWVSRYSNNPAAFYDAGVDYAIGQIRDLIEGGADGIHLYAMNNARLAHQIYDGISDLL